MITTQLSITVFELDGEEIVEVKNGNEIIKDLSTLSEKQKDLLRNIASNQQPYKKSIVTSDSSRNEQKEKANELAKSIFEISKFLINANRNEVGEEIIRLAEKEVSIQKAELADLEAALGQKLPKF